MPNVASKSKALTDQQLLDALDEAKVLALTLLGEARGEEIEGRAAVGCVIRQRVLDDRWPDDYKGVCLQRSQFSCWNLGDPNRTLLLNIARGVEFGNLLDEATWIAQGIISGVVHDRAGFGRANHYVTRTLWERKPPEWLRGLSPTCLVRNHAFFRL
jgi:spore germination cell wall hydrolase CwlJ-like protein